MELNKKIICLIIISLLVVSLSVGCIESIQDIEAIKEFIKFATDGRYVEVKYEIELGTEYDFDYVVVSVTNHGYDEVTVSMSDCYFNINQVKVYPSWMINPDLVMRTETTLFDGGTKTFDIRFFELPEDIRAVKLEVTDELRGKYNVTIIHPQEIKSRGD